MKGRSPHTILHMTFQVRPVKTCISPERAKSLAQDEILCKHSLTAHLSPEGASSVFYVRIATEFKSHDMHIATGLHLVDSSVRNTKNLNVATIIQKDITLLGLVGLQPLLTMSDISLEYLSGKPGSISFKNCYPLPSFHPSLFCYESNHQERQLSCWISVVC